MAETTNELKSTKISHFSCYFFRQDDGRLLWYLSVPADSWEVPNGYLLLRGARVSCSEGALLRNNLREDEVK